MKHQTGSSQRISMSLSQKAAEKNNHTYTDYSYANMKVIPRTAANNYTSHQLLFTEITGTTGRTNPAERVMILHHATCV